MVTGLPGASEPRSRWRWQRTVLTSRSRTRARPKKLSDGQIHRAHRTSRSRHPSRQRRPGGHHALCERSRLGARWTRYPRQQRGNGHTGAIADIDVNDYQAVMDVNVRAPVLFAKAVIPHLSEGGRIITIGSSLGERVPFPGITAYAMSKAALTSFTRGLSRELGPNGIIVNLLQPGATDTDSNPADGEAADFQRSLTSLGRYAQPREVANAVVFLASPAASVITAPS